MANLSTDKIDDKAYFTIQVDRSETTDVANTLSKTVNTDTNDEDLSNGRLGGTQRVTQLEKYMRNQRNLSSTIRPSKTKENVDVS